MTAFQRSLSIRNSLLGELRFLLRPYFTARSGLSLLEMVIVLAILAGMMAMVWPNLSRPLQWSSLREASNILKSVLEDSRYQAMTTGQIWLVRLDSESQQLQNGPISQFTNLHEKVRVARDLRTEPVPMVHSLPDGIEIADVLWAAKFDRHQSDDELQDERTSESMGRTWWIPLLANGNSKDFSVRIHDASTGRSNWLIYSGATGDIQVLP